MALRSFDLFTTNGLIRFRDLCVKINACEPAISYLNDCIQRQWSMRQAIESSPELTDNEFREWAVWARQRMANLMSPEFRLATTLAAVSNDPLRAAQLCVTHDDLDQFEAQSLLELWHSAFTGDLQFPELERELETSGG